ncbi:CHAP domain-containing protein [Nocardia carnea]|uniref:CHAP domain-containing protein n=1 Tax=Nocardia carnea TaxID=37328 RepID=UPI0024540641|nr:CHAP domain-containing protein [Nocardia carnea]
MATRADLEIDLDPPAAARPSAVAVIEMVEQGIQAQVLLVATDYTDTTYDVDPVGWLRNQGMLSAEGIDAPDGESAMIDSYGNRRGEIGTKTAELQHRNDSVDKSAIAAFKTGDNTFQDIKSKVGLLQERLSQAPGASTGEQYMPITAEWAAVNDALNTLWDVVELVNSAQRDMERYAEDVERSTPGNNGNPTQSWGARSPESRMTFTVTGDATRRSILDIAREELKLGAVERGGSSNDVYYRETGERAPYDIDAPWCAAFTSYVWEKAGYQVDWTNPNYVPAIWNDAKAKLDTATPRYAEEGDLIIFDWQGDGTPDHIGIVEKVEGSTITTIEGNSSNELRRNEYQMGNNDLVGVVKPPTGAATDSVRQ